MNQSKYPFGDAEIAALREQVIKEMSPKRFHHTAAVEEMVTRLATLFCPEDIPALRVAALLHDITKEYSAETHMEILTRSGQAPAAAEAYAYKTFHARTAALLIPEKYPVFNCETVVSAVRWHTTGHEGMTLPEKLLYLADYIDESRLFPDCVRLRSFFWNTGPEGMTMEERHDHLRRTLIMSYDMTMRALLSEDAVISPDTALARNELVLEELISQHNRDKKGNTLCL